MGETTYRKINQNNLVQHSWDGIENADHYSVRNEQQNVALVEEKLFHGSKKKMLAFPLNCLCFARRNAWSRFENCKKKNKNGKIFFLLLSPSSFSPPPRPFFQIFMSFFFFTVLQMNLFEPVSKKRFCNFFIFYSFDFPPALLERLDVNNF